MLPLFELPDPVATRTAGFVELGSYGFKRLHRIATIDFYPWNRLPVAVTAQKSPSDPLRLARYYRSLLDTGKFESRAALARFLGVSRARVTQVLNRLKSPADEASGEPDVA